jgi:hypothetical protein
MNSSMFISVIGMLTSAFLTFCCVMGLVSGDPYAAPGAAVMLLPSAVWFAAEQRVMTRPLTRPENSLGVVYLIAAVQPASAVLESVSVRPSATALRPPLGGLIAAAAAAGYFVFSGCCRIRQATCSRGQATCVHIEPVAISDGG